MTFRYIAVFECDGCGLELTFDMKDAQQISTPMYPDDWEQVQANNIRTNKYATLAYCPSCYRLSDFGRAIGVNDAESMGSRPGVDDGPGDNPDGGVTAPV